MESKKPNAAHRSAECCLLGCLLKLLIFHVQKAAAPKIGVEFRQKSIGALRLSLAMLYDDLRRRETSLNSIDIHR